MINPPRTYRQNLGQIAESTALRYLLSRGLVLLTQNYRCRTGEIDLVMRHHQMVVFVEVRYRKSTGYGGSDGSVTYFKQRKIISAARHFLMQNKVLATLDCRFDVVGITLAANNIASCDWIQDAFY